MINQTAKVERATQDGKLVITNKDGKQLTWKHWRTVLMNTKLWFHSYEKPYSTPIFYWIDERGVLYPMLVDDLADIIKKYPVHQGVHGLWACKKQGMHISIFLRQHESERRIND